MRSYLASAQIGFKEEYFIWGGDLGLYWLVVLVVFVIVVFFIRAKQKKSSQGVSSRVSLKEKLPLSQTLTVYLLEVDDENILLVCGPGGLSISNVSKA
ncbi:hypothetical protein ACJJIQ_14465 [Microbulbifer sp. ANSA003]|uniref:hypothetical protein n=1 Tax=unclassified Microbulbifer TaxID=2619833 RepID=UPI00403B2DA3